MSASLLAKAVAEVETSDATTEVLVVVDFEV
jgi:hypothetical protein